MGGLGILLQVCIIMGFEAPAHIDLVRIVYRSTYPGADIAVLDHALFKQGDIDNLPDERAREGLQSHVLDTVLDVKGDLLCSLLACALIPVKSFNEFGFFDNLTDNALAVPFDDMPVCCTDVRECRDGDALKCQLLGFPVCHYSPDISLDRCSVSSLPAGKRSADVKKSSSFWSTGASETKTPFIRSSVSDSADDRSRSRYW